MFWFNKFSFKAAVLLQIAIAAASPVSAGSDPFAEMQGVNDQELEGMRGGYVPAVGVEISFGIENAVFVDGILQALTILNSSPMDNAIQPQMVVQTTGMFSSSGIDIVRSGLSMPAIDADAIRSQLVTVVQNSEDYKIIDNITMINASVSSRGFFREMNFLASLQHQLIDSRR